MFVGDLLQPVADDPGCLARFEARSLVVFSERTSVREQSPAADTHSPTRGEGQGG
jgi:hypothetical protein